MAEHDNSPYTPRELASLQEAARQAPVLMPGEILTAIESRATDRAFEMMRHIAHKLSYLRSIDPELERRTIVDAYRERRELRGMAAVFYLEFCDAVDLMAYAVHVDAVDRGLVMDYLGDTLRAVIPESFLVSLQDAAEVPEVYHHTRQLLYGSKAGGATS